MTACAADFELLYESMMKCKCGVIWKDSVAHFYLNWLSELIKLESQIKSGTYKERPPHEFVLTSPKRRVATSISYRDRVYQRSLNDNFVYPDMTRSFIYDNAACQKGKGTDFARKRFKKALQDYVHKHGTEGYIGYYDILGYYAHLRHAHVNHLFMQRIKRPSNAEAVKVLSNQYSGDMGYNPGSQMVQIAGISALDPFDHFSTEVMRINGYRRYMDDFRVISKTREDLKAFEKAASEQLAKIGLELHPRKCGIATLQEGATYLGFIFRVTRTGKVLMLLSPENVSRERKHLKNMVAKCKRGCLSRERVTESFNAWINHAEKGDTFKVKQRMIRYYSSLWKGEDKTCYTNT